jgi:hypothetical protein
VGRLPISYPYVRCLQNYSGYKFVFFVQDFVGLARHDFHRNNITPQTLTLARLVSAKKS